MMKTKILYTQLENTIQNHINFAEELKIIPIDKLNHKNTTESWSILECIEHLCLYGDYYLPEIEVRISKSKYSSDENFKSGILGNYFAKSMLPKEKIKKMKTFKDKNPVGSKLDKDTLDRFIAQQQKMIELLNKSKKISLNKTKTSISISKFIKLRLGDTFQFVINHDIRHIIQVEKLM